jgi:glycosyltransferase involved in cell wall biosynthesis
MLCGPLPAERMGEVLQEAFALALPAQWYENEPLVVKAALWCGVPVAAGRIGSLAQLITPGQNGWLLPVSDIDAWAEWLKEPAPCSPLPGAQETDVPTADEFAAQMMQIYQDLARSAR